MKETKIMVVEDEIVVAEDIKEMLIALDYTVCAVVRTAEDAIKKAEENKPDLIIMDIVLAGEMDGITASELICSTLNVPVIYFTAYTGKEYVDRAKLTAPYAYLFKPVESMELSISIELALYKHSMEMEIKDKNIRLKQMMSCTIDTIDKMISIKNPFIGDHQLSTCKLSMAIAEEMALPQDRIDGIGLAAKVHDIGLINIPFELFSKPTLLNVAEHRVYESHSKTGYDLLKDIDFDWPIAETVLQCHERMDGTGYPSGLKEEDILLEAKIVSVASFVDCYVKGRPNMPPISMDEALGKLTQRKGIHFDSDAVDACVKVIKEGGFVLELPKKYEVL